MVKLDLFLVAAGFLKVKREFMYLEARVFEVFSVGRAAKYIRIPGRFFGVRSVSSRAAPIYQEKPDLSVSKKIC